jgi:hypothetical protein
MSNQLRLAASVVQDLGALGLDISTIVKLVQALAD